MEQGYGLPNLVELCVDAACESKGSVQAWRRQTRTLQRLPSHLAQALFHRLLHAGLLNPPLLELFQYSTEEVIVSGDGLVNAEWTAYFKYYQCIRVLKAANCRALSNFAISHLKGLETLQELDLSGCPKITDEGLAHVLCLTSLQKLGLSETKITAKGLESLSILKDLISLDLGGLPVMDSTLQAFTTLKKLQRLDIWGSRVSNHGVLYLREFLGLNYVNLAWTEVTIVPPLQSLKQLNMANCTIHSLFESWKEVDGKLEVLNLSGSNLTGPLQFLKDIGARNLSVIDFSSSNFQDFKLLDGLKKVQKLDLSGTKMQDTAMQTIANIGENLQHLDLSGCSVTSAGVRSIANCVPRLQQLVLSGTLVDDLVFISLHAMPSLSIIDLSYTNIKGCTVDERERASKTASFAAVKELTSLRILNLQNTSISDNSCLELSFLSELTRLDLRSELLSDSCLQFLSCLKKLLFLSIEGAMLTDEGLLSFKPPPFLEVFSLLDCWLLTKKALTHFCEVHKDISVKHHLVPVLSASPKGPLPKKNKTKGSQISGSNYVKSKSTGRPNAQSSGFQMEKEDLTILSDQRIKYSRPELLELRKNDPSDSQPAFVKPDLPPLLSSMDELAGLLKVR